MVLGLRARYIHRIYILGRLRGMSRSALEVCLFVISQSKYANEVFKYANEVFNVYLQQQSIWIILCIWITLEFTATHLPSFATVAYTVPWIFAFFVISQSECKWDIYYVHSMTTDPVGITCAHHYLHTKFCHYSPYRTLDICPFCY